MYEFISNDLDSKQVFYKVDKFYDGWFTSRSISWENFLKTFPKAFSWGKDEIFPAMLWLYYNYPVDYLASKNSHVPGIRNYRRANIIRIACFLKKSGQTLINRFAILKTLTETNDAYKTFKTDKDRLEFIKTIVDEQPLNIEMVLDKPPFSPLLKDIIKRTSPKIMFTQKAIKLDKELIPKLLVLFVSWENTWRASKEDKREKRSKQIVEIVPARKGHLLDQIILEMETAWKQPDMRTSEQKQEQVQVLSERKVSTVPFVPYREEIGFDIDPNVIANKILQISIPNRSVPEDWSNLDPTGEALASSQSPQPIDYPSQDENPISDEQNDEIDIDEYSNDFIEV